MRYLAILVSCLMMTACNDKPADSPDDALGEGEGEGEGEGATDDKPKDNIVRDADGDGVPDDQAESCNGMPETRCKITSGCAWTDAGSCVDAKSNPM